MSPFLIISRADVDKAYVWALHSSVTGTLRVKGNKYLLSIGPYSPPQTYLRNDKTTTSSLYPRGLPISTETH